MSESRDIVLTAETLVRKWAQNDFISGSHSAASLGPVAAKVEQ
jgi:hypothetical protein